MNKKIIEAETAKHFKRRTNAELLKKYVSENNEVFRTDGKELFCKICEKSISFDTKYSVHRHLKSKKHQTITPGTSNEAKSKLVKDEIAFAEMLLKKYVSENSEVLETDGEILLCKVCKKSVSFDSKISVDQHLKTEMHKRNIYAQRNRRAPLNCANKNFSSDCESLFILKKNQDFCRTCMKQFSKTKQNDNGKQSLTEIPTGCTNNTSIMELLEIIQPQIKVEITDYLPMLMCSDCIEKLLVSYKFIKMYQNSDKNLRNIVEKFNDQQKYSEEMEEQHHFEDNNYENEIEQIEIVDFGKNENIEGNKLSEIEDEYIHELSDSTENIVETVLLSSDSDASDDDCSLNKSCYDSDASDDDWSLNKSCLNNSPKKHNSNENNDDDDDVTKKVFKGFLQPEENEDGSLTCLLCESVADGVVPWREHIRQNHLEERPRRAYNRRTKEARKNLTSNVPKKVLPNEKGLFQCEYCEKSYPKYLFYRRHLRKHTEGTHLCIECGKSFSNITSYNTHMLRHKGEKNFQCSQCPKSFVCASGLYGHMMTHNNEKPYVCDICGSAFRMQYQLRNHNRVHTGVKNYKCEYCDRRFKSRPNQVCHMRTHTGEKPFRCKYCERAFAQSGDCVKHMRQHLGGDTNVYPCDLCPLRFPLVRELRTHFETHKDDDEETRNRNLQARMEEERNLQIKLRSNKSV